MSAVLVRSFQVPRLVLFGVIALGLAGIACTVSADPKSPFIGEWTFHTKGKRNEAHLAMLQTGACRMKLAEDRNYAYLDTLAAALARDGQFERAAKCEEEALAVLDVKLFGPDRESTQTRFNNRLALYKAGQVYTEP